MNIFIMCFYVSVFLGADESASGGVKIKSILFQDSVQLSGLVVSAMFDLDFFYKCHGLVFAVVVLLLNFFFWADFRI